MSIRNKIKVNFHREDGGSKDEVSTCWCPVNFDIYSSVFFELIDLAISDWLSDNEVGKNIVYEVIFAHVVERDGGGALVGEYFEPFHVETQSM